MPICSYIVSDRICNKLSVFMLVKLEYNLAIHAGNSSPNNTVSPLQGSSLIISIIMTASIFSSTNNAQADIGPEVYSLIYSQQQSINCEQDL